MATDDTTTVRVSRELVDLAKKEAAVLSRSVSAQVEHWARLGQSVENIQGLTLEDLRVLISGRIPRAGQVILGGQVNQGDMTIKVGRKKK